MFSQEQKVGRTKKQTLNLLSHTGQYEFGNTVFYQPVFPMGKFKQSLNLNNLLFANLPSPDYF